MSTSLLSLLSSTQKEPSVIDLYIIQEIEQSAIRSTVNILDWLGSFPRTSKLKVWSEEISLIIWLFGQYYYLEKTDSCVVESLYGLSFRKNSKKPKAIPVRLFKTQKVVILAMKILVPYIIKKMNDLVERDFGSVKNFLLHACSKGMAVFSLLDVFQQLIYATGITPYFHIYWKLLGVSLSRSTESISPSSSSFTSINGKHSHNMSLSSASPPLPSSSSSSSSSSSMSHIVGSVFVVVVSFKLFQLFGESIVEGNFSSWNLSSFPFPPLSVSSSSSSSSSSPATTKISSSNSMNDHEKDFIPPPESPSLGNEGCILPISSSNSSLNHSTTARCPLCRMSIVKPCVSISGYLFCWDCLSCYVETNKKCPISGERCLLSDIIILRGA